jgi:lipoprotein-releasing system ATP-binding protein
MIKAAGITKSYGELRVLKGIDLNISEKEVVSIVGASGAGKTTLLQIIGTLDNPDSGSIFYKGTDICKLRGKQLASFRNGNIGFVFQFHQLLPEFTALENVCIPAYIAGKSKSEAEGKASELLSFLNLSDRLEHKPSELSGGEQQRVAVARALINTENKNELHKLFFKLRDTFNQTIIIVTHDRQLAAMSDRILQIKDGLIVNEA